MVVVRALKDILKIKIKNRHDDACDQFSRLFMTRVLLIASFLTGFNYFSDKISCIIPPGSNLSQDFVHSACWISGFYIYEEMKNKLSMSSYYGIPQKITHEGLTEDEKLCFVRDIYGRDPECMPMTKIFYLQYQWLPFYIGTISLLYYMPYIFYSIVNTDIISLKKAVDSSSGDVDALVKNYFNYNINSVFRLRLRVFLNVGVKLFYLVCNLFGFYFTDYLLLGNYLSYGFEYIKWSKLNSNKAHEFVNARLTPKPGEVLLPSMGFCEIFEAYKETTLEKQNANKFICEYSTNILNQYVLILLWFFFVAGIFISAFGLARNVTGHVYQLWCVRCISGIKRSKKSITCYITLREIEYLEFMKKSNMVLYGDVLRKLRQLRPDLHGKIAEGFETSNNNLKGVYIPMQGISHT
ncbi:innexin inx3 isoform X1 [Hydra vulgaris]|uniref:Innexin n=1 Tax=Hydra vulgaris TaxID=6087 RepID=A0ABM4DJB1_HYDVU